MRWDNNYQNPEPINDPVVIPAYGVTDEERARWNAKQDALEYDARPTQYSDKMLISGAIYNALEFYKIQTLQSAQDFFWGVADGLGETRHACLQAAEDAEASKQAAAESEGSALLSKNASAISAQNASAYAHAAEVSKNNADYAAVNANNRAIDSEAFALGTRNGVPVEPGDPAYHHNAQYFADIGTEVIDDTVVSLYNTWSSNKLTEEYAGKADLVDGKVPAAQLPSYVDDVLEYATSSDFPATGESGKIYVALDTNRTYRWSGSTYVEISESLALGETAGTAYEGNKGKANADAISAIQDLIPSTASSSNKLAVSSALPTALSQLSDDAAHRLVTDTEKAGWDSKAAGNHNHDDRYYTETEIDTKFNGVTFTTVSDDVYINW